MSFSFQSLFFFSFLNLVPVCSWGSQRSLGILQVKCNNKNNSNNNNNNYNSSNNKIPYYFSLLLIFLMLSMCVLCVCACVRVCVCVFSTPMSSLVPSTLSVLQFSFDICRTPWVKGSGTHSHRQCPTSLSSF